MHQANRVDSRAKKLKDLLASINQFPRLAKQSPLVKQANLQRLATNLHLAPDQLATSPDEQIRHIGKALTLTLFLAEYKKDMHNLPFLHGLLMFWHSYPAPISAAHPAPSVTSVIAYCADVNNLRDFLHEAQRWANHAYANDSELLRTVLTLLSPETFRKQVIGGMPVHPSDSERRTYGNYLNTASRELALRLESFVPELFTENESVPDETQKMEQQEGNANPIPAPANAQIQVYPPKQLGWVAQWMINVGFRLPGLGADSLRVDGYLERPLVFRTVRGQPRAPTFVAGAEPDLKGMSAFLSGVQGSGRSAFLKCLTYQYSRQFLLDGYGALAYYFSANDFVVHARNRRSVHDLIADSLLERGGNLGGIEELPDLLRTVDRAGKLLLLVDDVDRLSDADQAEVITQLAFSPNVVFSMLPWQVEKLSRIVTRSHLGHVALVELTPVERLALVERLKENPHYSFEMETIRQWFAELPDLSKSPLGVVAILEQATRQEKDATHATETALKEFAARAELPRLEDAPDLIPLPQEWIHLFSAAADLTLRLRVKGGYEELAGEPDVMVTQFMVENPNGHAWNMSWAEVARTGLFRPVPYVSDGLAIINRDLTCYLMALVVQHERTPFVLPTYPIHPSAMELLQRAYRHVINLQKQRRRLSAWGNLPSPREPTKPKPAPLFGWIPELFRNSS